jgi:pimeloyl-ACP methyl ester carboxylesterase
MHAIQVTLIVIAVCWTIVAQFTCRYRYNVEYAKKLFIQKGVVLETHNDRIASGNIHFVKPGSDDNPTIYFIHGSPGSWNVWEKYLYDKDLLAHFRMIAADRPGFGFSEFGKTMEMQRQADLLATLIDSTDNEREYYVVGHSFGAPVAIHIASQRPGRVEGLLILAGTIDPSQEKKSFWRLLITYTPLRWWLPPGWRYSNQEMYKLKDGLQDQKDDYRRINCPVWLLHGNKDRIASIKNMDYGKGMLVNAASCKTIVLNGHKHFILWTAYDTIKDLLLQLTKSAATPDSLSVNRSEKSSVNMNDRRASHKNQS